LDKKIPPDQPEVLFLSSYVSVSTNLGDQNPHLN
jgi:hypothetical protein